MTDLQLSLIAIGSAFIVGVFSYNKWQEHKAKKNVERVFSSTQEDVLMKTEPHLGADSEQVAATPINASDTEPSIAADTQVNGVEPAEALSKPSSTLNRDLVLDPIVDFSIPLALGAPLRGEKILPIIQPLRHVGNKPVNYVGLRREGEWEQISHGSLYSEMYAGIQLANRNGPLNEIEYSEFVAGLRRVADELNAEPDLPNMTKVITAARELHQFVAEYDAQLSVNIQANKDSWPVNTLLAALERQGFDLRPDGRLVMPDGDGGVLFSLSTNAPIAAETTAKLTLLLDVPRVAPDRDGFGAMIACAKSLAARLDGTIVDDANQPIPAASLTEIAAQVRDFYEQMETAEIPAGSKRALRLFS